MIQTALEYRRPARVHFEDLRELVELRQPFKMASVFAVGDEDNYVVYSFGTYHPILVYLGGVWYQNSAPSPVTTTRHICLCRPDTHIEFRSMGFMRGVAAAVQRNLEA